jgi:hypothetical protein
VVMVQGPVGRALGSGKSCTPHMRVRVHSVLSSSFAEVRRVPAVGDEQLISAIPFLGSWTAGCTCLSPLRRSLRLPPRAARLESPATALRGEASNGDR